MQVFSADFLTDLRELPFFAKVILALVGTGLWLFGWRMHRFWFVFACTSGAGIFGLRVGPEFGVPPIVGGLLLAVGAGFLCLSLTQAAVFVASAFITWVVAQTFFPHWISPLIVLVLGGLLGIAFFQLWVVGLSSAAGALILGYAILLLVDHFGKGDPVALLAKRSELFSGGYVAAVVLGIMLQFWFESLGAYFAERKKTWLDFKSKQKPPANKSWISLLKKAG